MANLDPNNQQPLGSNKAVAVGIGGSIVTILAWVATWVSPSHPIPAEVAAAITTIVNAALAYFVPHKFGG